MPAIALCQEQANRCLSNRIPLTGVEPFTGDATIATVHSLQRHTENASNRELAADIFHRFHHDPPEAQTESVFNDLYQEVAEVETNDLEQLFAEWNAGSGQESDQFIDLRYCECCQTYIEGQGEATTHAAQNHGYDSFHDASEPMYIRGIQSMSVGDIVEHGESHYACAPIGWQELNIVKGDTE